MGGKRSNRRRNALRTLSDLADRVETVLVIHYSCESFYDTKDDRTPRITSIAVRNLASGQTESFSIHKIAELQQIPLGEISENYDNIERMMLDGFFEYSQSHQGHKYLHWNMRDINYGFAAIEHRYKVLGGTPYKIEDIHKYDMARLLIDIYGRRYIGHPRLKRLVDKNHITDIDFLSGAEEALAFQKREYVKLHRSTLRKVDTLANIFERTLDGSLKTEAKLPDVYGLHPADLADLVKEHWVFVLIAFAATLVSLILAVVALM